METNMCTPRLAVDDDDVEFNSITLWLVMVKACTLPLRGATRLRLATCGRKPYPPAASLTQSVAACPTCTGT